MQTTATDDELKEWLRTMYPFLANPGQVERFVEIVRESEQAGMRLGFARITGVRIIADAQWPRKAVQVAQ